MASRDATAEYQPWYERWPDLEKEERRRFDAHGLPWAEDPVCREHGFLGVDTQVQFKGEPVDIKVVYPSEYPELPPWVTSDPPILERHQQPYSLNFCLLERPIDSWPGRTWGAADLIIRQLLPLLRHSEAGEEVVRENEAPMPEPATAHFRYEPNSVVLIPGNLASPEGDAGEFRIDAFDGCRYVLSRVGDLEGDPRLVEQLPHHNALTGRWKRLEGPPPVGPSGQEVLAWVRAKHPELVPHAPPPPPPRKKGNRQKSRHGPQVAAFVFPEERDAEGTTKDAWMFLRVDQGRGALLHAQEVSVEERLRRIPDLKGLDRFKAVVVGLGSLGGDVALHLARAGIGGLHLLDNDRFEANNGVRHSLGLEYAGVQKTEALHTACRRANPFCEIEVSDIQLGAFEPTPPMERLHRMVAEADIVIDTTGVHQLEHLTGPWPRLRLRCLLAPRWKSW